MSITPMETPHRVRGYDCGYGGSFTPLALANYFQEAAGDHARLLGVGMEDMFAAGRTWMLSRIDIEVSRLPESGDEVVTRTWPAGTDRLFAARYLELLDNDGRRLAGARYEYLIVDLEKRKPLRPQGILDPGLICHREPPYPDLAPGLGHEPGFAATKGERSPGAAFLKSFDLVVCPRHIDYNGHVNNAHLINWLCDASLAAGGSAGSSGKPGLARLKVDFVSEAVEGDSIEAWRMGTAGSPAAAGSSHLCALTRGGEYIARAFVAWKESGRGRS